MNPFVKHHLIPGAAFILGRMLGATLRCTVIGEKEALAHIKEHGLGMIIVCWHGRTLVPITRYYRRGYWSMISTSSDGEFMNNVFRRFGFNTVRGSTSARGAVKATLSLVKQLKTGSILAMAPDGPRGPAHVVQPGAVYLAMKSGCPIVPIGIGAAPRRIWNSWDRYMMPLPFAKVAFVYGDLIPIPPDCTQEEQKEWAETVGRAIDDVEARAEAMVGNATDHASATRDALRQA